jgi:hypothetical protein
MHHPMRSLFTLLCLLTLSFTARAQIKLEVVNDTKGGAAGTTYRYLFENDRFTTPYQEVEFGADGKGMFRFRKKEGGQLGDEIANQIALSPAVVRQAQALLDEVGFLESEEDYQFKKDFSHLGKVTITHTHGGRTRTVSFNYTANPAMSRLVDLFRNIATQETRVFELETVRASDPISTPAQLRMLDTELRSKHLADPERLLPLLDEIKHDEGVPLIARNHAERLIQAIKKGK